VILLRKKEKERYVLGIKMIIAILGVISTASLVTIGFAFYNNNWDYHFLFGPDAYIVSLIQQNEEQQIQINNLEQQNYNQSLTISYLNSDIANLHQQISNYQFQLQHYQTRIVNVMGYINISEVPSPVSIEFKNAFGTYISNVTSTNGIYRYQAHLENNMLYSVTVIGLPQGWWFFATTPTKTSSFTLSTTSESYTYNVE